MVKEEKTVKSKRTSFELIVIIESEWRKWGESRS